MFFTSWKLENWIAITFGLSGLVVSLINIARANQTARKLEKQSLNEKRMEMMQVAMAAEITTNSQQTTAENLLEEIDDLLPEIDGLLPQTFSEGLKTSSNGL